MKINGNNRIGIMESGAKLSQNLSQFHGITAYPWATEKLLSDYRKPLCKKEISQKSAFINTKTTPPRNNPTLSVFAVAVNCKCMIHGHCILGTWNGWSRPWTRRAARRRRLWPPAFRS